MRKADSKFSQTCRSNCRRLLVEEGEGIEEATTSLSSLESLRLILFHGNTKQPFAIEAS